MKNPDVNKVNCQEICEYLQVALSDTIKQSINTAYKQFVAFNTCNWSKNSLGHTHMNTFSDAYSMTSLGFFISHSYMTIQPDDIRYVHAHISSDRLYTVDALAVALRHVRHFQFDFAQLSE